MGLSLSTIFLVYTGASIASTFFASAAAFGGLSLYGYTTKKDLSGFGTFLIMGVVGLIVASVINMFMQSSARSEEHTSELQSLMRIPSAVLRLKKKTTCHNQENK